MAARLVKVFHVRLKFQDGAINAPHPLAAFNKDAPALRVAGDRKPGVDEQGPAKPPVPPPAKTADDSSVLVLRDDQMVGEEKGREPPAQTDSGLSEWAVKPGKRRRTSDESLSVATIAATMAAVIVVGFAFVAILPSILTRDGVESEATVITTTLPEQPPPIEQVGAVQPAPALVPAPAQLAAPAPPPPAAAPSAPAAPVSTASTSVAKSTPALRTSTIPSGKQSDRPATAAGSPNLTAAEKAAVARGVEELAKAAAVSTKTAAVSAPRRPAPTRFALTDEEKAAVERGLRELEKAAGQTVPAGQP